MIKLIILMAFGRRIKHPNRIFYLVKSYLIFYMLALPLTNFAQSFEWINPYPVEMSTNTDMLNVCISVNSGDQIFWGGMFMFHEYYASAAFGDLNIIKHNPDGNEVFTFYAYGSGNIVNMIHDHDDNLILIIDIREDMLLDSADTLYHSGDNVSSHLLKLNSDFDLLWTKMIVDDFSYSMQKGITIDSENNIYYGYDNFQHSQIVILDPDGEEINSIMQENVTSISSIAIDDEGNIYSAGSCADFGATYGGVPFETPMTYNTYIAKYNSQQEVQWVKFVEDITCQFPKILVSDPDHIYFTGELYFSTLFDSIPANGPNWVYDYFVAKLNANGEFEWVAEVPEPTVITGDASIGKLVNCTLDSENNICITGFIRGEIDWGNGITTSSTNIGYDLLVVKYNTEGEVILTKHGGGDSYDKAISSAIDSNDNLYIAGFGYDSIFFDEVTTYYDGYYPYLLKLNVNETSTGVLNPGYSQSLKLYPNPVSEFLTIQLGKIPDEIVNIRVQNIDGSILNEFLISGESIIRIDMSAYQSGVYLLNINASNQNYPLQKIVKL